MDPEREQRQPREPPRAAAAGRDSSSSSGASPAPPARARRSAAGRRRTARSSAAATGSRRRRAAGTPTRSTRTAPRRSRPRGSAAAPASVASRAPAPPRRAGRARSAAAPRSACPRPRTRPRAVTTSTNQRDRATGAATPPATARSTNPPAIATMSSSDQVPPDQRVAQRQRDVPGADERRAAAAIAAHSSEPGEHQRQRRAPSRPRIELARRDRPVALARMEPVLVGVADVVDRVEPGGEQAEGHARQVDAARMSSWPSAPAAPAAATTSAFLIHCFGPHRGDRRAAGDSVGATAQRERPRRRDSMAATVTHDVVRPTCRSVMRRLSGIHSYARASRPV